MKDLDDCRKRINELDLRLLDLLNRRAECVIELAPLKRERKIDVHDPGRERQVLDNLRRRNQGPLSDEAVSRVFEAIMAAMRRLQKQETAAE